MSMFDKLKAYSRKPAAVILATVMATSTIPTTPIAQAVTAAYAAETSTSEPAKSEYKSKATSSVDLTGRTISLTFDSKVPKGVDGTARATIKKSDLEDLVYSNSHELFDDALDKAVDAKLKEIEKDPKKQNVKLYYGNGGSKYHGRTYDVSLTSDTEGVVVKEIDKDTYEVSSDKVVENAKLTLTVKSASFGYMFKYSYEDVVEPTEKPEPGEGAGGADSSNPAGDSKGNGDSATGKAASGSDNKTKYDVVDTEKTGEKVNLDEETVAKINAAFAADTISVTSNDAWNGVQNAIDAVKQNGVTVNDLKYENKGTAKTVVLFNAPEGLTLSADTKGNDFVSVSEPSYKDGVYSISVTPKACDPSNQDVVAHVKVEYPNKEEAGDIAVTIKPAAKQKVDLGGMVNSEALPFRLAKDQKKEILKTANGLVKDATNGEVSDLFESVTITEEEYNKAAFATDDTALDSSALEFKLRGSKDNLDKLNNYDFTADGSQITQPKIKVAKIEDVDWNEKSGVTLTGLTYNEDYYKNQGNKDYSKTIHKADDNLWYRNVATVGVDGENAVAVSQDIEDNQTVADLDFAKQQTFKTSASANQLAKFYTQNSDKVIKRVCDVNYNYDHTRPSLTSFTAKASGSKKAELKSGSHAGALVADRITVDFDAKDGPTNDGTGVSGIADVQANYQIQKSGQKAASPKAEDYGKYTFEIDEDSKVSTDSIHVKMVDNAGNTNDQTLADAKINPKYTELVRASSAPEISSSWDTTAASNGKYYNVSRTLTLTIKAPFYEYVQEYMENVPIATVTRDGKSWKSVFPTDFKETSEGSNVYTCSIPFTEDGDYVVSDCVVTDLIGRQAKADGDTFTIDKTAPKLNVSWNTEAAQNGKYYNAARTATITVEEHNFDPNLFKIEAPVSAGNGDEATPAQIGGWTSNGDTHTATVTFPGQGVYTLSVSGEDLASNKSESYTSPEFVIDTIKPKIDIQNVVNRTAYAGEVAPSAAVHDTNLADGTTIEVSKISYPLSKDDPNPYAGAAINTSATDKSVSYLSPAKTKGNDGVYTLTVQAIDLAGNTESEAVTWSVNRFGSTYVISDNTGKMLDQYLKSSKTTDVKVTEINPSGLDDNKTSVELTRDTKNTTLKSGDNYTTDSDTSSGWSEYNYTVSKSNYDKDGAYRVLFHSEDAAGNSSENTMEGKNAKKTGAAAEINFAVDDTAPIASFVDLASNGKYEESSHKAKVSFEDNLKLSKAQIKVNGKTVATFTADQLEKSPIREFTLDGSSSKQDVTVVAWDAAGNKSKELKATGVLVTNDSFVLWMNNLPLMIGTIVAIVVVAGGIYLVVAKKRKENEEN